MDISYVSQDRKEKLAKIPGTADWIATKKASIEKRASEIKNDPYSATKTVAIAGALGVPGDILFDLGVKASSHYKENRQNFAKGIKGIKSMFRSPAWKSKLKEFKTEQKGIAIPASIAMASIPAFLTFKNDRKKYHSTPEFKQKVIENMVFNKTASKDMGSYKKHKVALTPEERKIVMDSKAVWHFNGGSPSPAVWKSVDPKTNEVTYITNTHRAMNIAPTLKGAISKFHSFIKGTA